MPQSIYQLKISLEGAESLVWRRILVSANVTLRQARGVLHKALATGAACDYVFRQDGREMGRLRNEFVYQEDDSMFSLRYCLCQSGDTLEYAEGPWRYSIVLEAILQAQGRFPWRVVEGAGVAPTAAPRTVASGAERRLH